MTSYLNTKLKLCNQPDAVFSSEKTLPGNPGVSARKQCLAAYSPRHLEAGHAAENQRAAQPIGVGGNDTEKTVEGYRLLWRGNLWEITTTAYTVKVHPQTDEADVKRWLKSFDPIQDRIVGRGLALRKLVITLGETPWEGDKGHVVARSENNNRVTDEDQIWFFTTGKSCRLLGATMEEGTLRTKEAVTLQGMILHEIGHTIENLLRDEIVRMEEQILENIEACLAITKTASPHYLGQEWPQIVEDLKTCDQAERLKKNITFQRQNESVVLTPEQFRRSKKSQLASELFAEVLREYYLEPVLVGDPKPATKTGWGLLDQITEFLEKETQESLQEEKTKRPPIGIKPIKTTEPNAKLAEGINIEGM